MNNSNLTTIFYTNKKGALKGTIFCYPYADGYRIFESQLKRAVTALRNKGSYLPLFLTNKPIYVFNELRQIILTLNKSEVTL